MAKCDKCGKEEGRRIRIADGKMVCCKCYQRIDIFEAVGLPSLDDLLD